jgi:hypothetical protein
MCQLFFWHIHSRRAQAHQLDYAHLDEHIMQTASVTPISKKAKNRFANLMDRIETCIIEQHMGNKVFLTSINGKNHFWVTLDNDPDWMIQ